VRTAEELIDRIVNSSQIPAGKRRREIQRELRSHIEDVVVAARAAGSDPNEIERLVLANFGDPGQIASGFAWVYRHERRRLRVFAYTASTLLLASCLAVTVLTMQAGLAFGLGTSVMKVLASRHTVMEALDILASVAVYLGMTSLENLFARDRFLKAGFGVAAIVAILMGSCAAAGLHIGFLLYGLVNGVFCRAVELFVPQKVVRAGIVAVCFPVAGILLNLQRTTASSGAFAAICASWLIMGAGYQLMTHLAGRFDAALRNGLRKGEMA
jgi:hypothetical protein